MDNKITLLIPCYNKEKYLPLFLDKLSSQTDKNFDVIFLDDKSTDNSLNILYDFQKNNTDLNVEIIPLKENGGLANARNCLIDNVKTKYFFFVDPDDCLLKNALKLFNKTLAKKDYDVVLAKNRLTFSRHILIPNVLSNFWSFKKSVKKYDNVSLAWLENTPPFAWNKAIKTSWFKKLNINFIIGRSYEDIAVMPIVLLKTNNVGYIDKYTLKYDVNMDGLSRIHDSRKFNDVFQNLLSLYEKLEENKLLNDWRFKSNSEIKIISKLFIHFFVDAQNKKTLKNFDQYLNGLEIFFIFMEKYQIEKRLLEYKSWWRFVLNRSIKNYKKVKAKFYSIEKDPLK